VGVCQYTNYLVAIAIRQRYAGHAKQAAHAALSCSATGADGRYIVVVDEDIDPTNLNEVLWAMTTRVEPTTDIEIVPDCRGTPLDPRMEPEKRAAGDFTGGRALIYAVRPFAWRERFPKSSRSDPALRRAMMERYRMFYSSKNEPRA
jgi:4-hydroxy-3-polyprenylbenzoate decarboxylase